MAAKKKKKAVKAKKAPAKKAKKAKKAAKKAKASKKAVKRPAKKTKKTVKAAAKKAPARKAKKSTKKKGAIGEGNYEASRAFDKDQASFVARNKSKIPAMGKAAEAELDGPQGDLLRDAEAAAAGRSRDTFEP
jgi:hypothetical protein